MSKKSIPTLALLTGLALLLVPDVAFAGGEGEFASALEKGWLWVFLAAFGAGVITSLTPCVYPMIPITVAVFGARDQSAGRLRSFLLAFCYVEGMAIFYTAVGTPFALAGGSAGGLLADWRVVIPISLVLFALALSFFGLFNLNLPGSWQAKLSQVGGRGYSGAFAMGLVGGLIAAPCTGPFLAGMIAFIARTGDPLIGAALLFAYAHGIGILFFVLAVSAVSLPKSGPWMEGVKSAGGILLVVGAIYFLKPILPALGELTSPDMIFLFAASLVAVIGVAIGAVHLNFHGAGWGVRLRKAFGIMLAVIGLTGVINWLETPARDIGWHQNKDDHAAAEEAAFAEAEEHDLHVMIDFGADWCKPCKKIENIMAEDEVFSELTESFVPLKFDVTDSNERDRAVQEKYGANTLPAVVFLDKEGNEIGRYNDKSPSTESFLATIREIAREHPPD